MATPPNPFSVRNMITKGTGPKTYTPLEQYAAYNPQNTQNALQTEKESRLGNLKTQFASQAGSLDAAQRQAQEQLGTDINRFAAMNNLSPGSGALLKIKEEQQNKQAQDFANQRASLGAEEAKSQEALNSEIGQRGFQAEQLGEQSRQFGGQLNLAMDESKFNKSVAAFQAQLAAYSEGIKNPQQWQTVIGDPQNGYFAQLFGSQGAPTPNVGADVAKNAQNERRLNLIKQQQSKPSNVYGQFQGGVSIG